MEENMDKWQKLCVTHRRITQGQQEDPVTVVWEHFAGSASVYWPSYRKGSLQVNKVGHHFYPVQTYILIDVVSSKIKIPQSMNSLPKV